MVSKVTRREWYRRVNAAWPEKVPTLTADEAVRAAKKLYRFERGYTWRGPVRVTSGRRASAIRGGVIIVNPLGGWHELVHLLSHYLSPGKHGADHARCELRMIKEVVRRGWLEGKLKSPEKVVVPVTVDEVRSKRKARLQERLRKWESRKKRAETAIRKLRKSIRYYEKLEAKTPAPGLRARVLYGDSVNADDAIEFVLGQRPGAKQALVAGV